MKRGQVEIIHLVAGFLVIVGGILIALNMANLGTGIATTGLLIEIIKLVIEKGL